MKETARISNMFSKQFDGEPWIDVNLADTLKNISPKKAAEKRSGNSIWEIVNHIISWRNHVLKRLKGKSAGVKSNNYFTKINDISAKAWKETLKRLEKTNDEWISFLNEFNPDDLDKVNPKSGLTYYEHIHSILHHDIYHLGQIVLLTKKDQKV